MGLLAIFHSREMDIFFVMLAMCGIRFHQTGVRSLQEHQQDWFVQQTILLTRIQQHFVMTIAGGDL
jgi:hypothetical protein